MKLLKKSIIFCFLILLVSSLFGLNPTNGRLASAANEKPTGPVTGVDNGLLDFVSISKYGEVLTYDNIRTEGNTCYIVTNDSLTITLQPFLYDYYTDALTNPNFHVTRKSVDPIMGQINPDTNEVVYDDFFVYDETTYYYMLTDENENINIYNVQPTSTTTLPIISSSFGNTYDISEDAENNALILSYTQSLTLKSTATDNTIHISVKSTKLTATYTINFLKPIVEFANAKEPIVEFTCTGLDAGPNEYKDYTIRREQSYNSVKIEFLSNAYTETNPLYFLLNSDGFIYTFELFSKEYNGENLLFVNYFDEYNENDNRYLGTQLIMDENGEYRVHPSNRVQSQYNEDINTFSLVFTNTGRYSFEVYDSTYLVGVKNPNYYSTSFFIKDENNTPFENIYIISQTQDDEGNPLEYIVSTSNLNHSVKTTIKNLANLGKDANGENIKLENVIDNVEIRKTTFGGSTNIPTKTIYPVSEILNQIDKNGDFNLFFDEDAYYEITIYRKDSDEITYHEFTIVKHAKTTFTIPLVDENGEPIFDETTGKQLSTTYEASVPFRTEIINYEKNILDSMVLSTKFASNKSVHEKKLDKTFINKYTISYGKEEVKIEQVKIEVGENEKKVDKIDLLVHGVGDLTVEVTFNGVTTVYTEINEKTLNSEKGNNQFTFTEYGKYTVRLVDSMGTETVGVFELKKKLNVSAMALIILSSLLAGIITIFVLRARAKIATR